MGSDPRDHVLKLSLGDDDDDDDDAFQSIEQPIHEMADVVVAYATIPGDSSDCKQSLQIIWPESCCFHSFPGYKAWRNTKLGSYFVRSVAYIFSKYSYKLHLMDLLLEVS